MSDVDRNIIGLDALRVRSPTVYLRLSADDSELPPPMNEWWMAHTHVAIASASLLQAALGDFAGHAFRPVTALGGLAMPGMVIRWGWQRRWPMRWVMAGGLLTWTYPARLDVAFAQGQLLAAIGAVLVLVLCYKEFRSGPVPGALLGAYRPSYILFAVAYLHPTSARTLLALGMSLMGSAALALPHLGGPHALVWFFEVATPANIAQQLDDAGNLAVFAGQHGGLLLGAATVVAWAFAHVSPSLRPGSIGLLMLIYPHCHGHTASAL